MSFRCGHGEGDEEVKRNILQQIIPAPCKVHQALPQNLSLDHTTHPVVDVSLTIIIVCLNAMIDRRKRALYATNGLTSLAAEDGDLVNVLLCRKERKAHLLVFWVSSTDNIYPSLTLHYRTSIAHKFDRRAYFHAACKRGHGARCRMLEAAWSMRVRVR